MPYLNQLKFSLFAVFLICFDIIDDQTLDQVVSVYPNPTVDIIRLDVKNLDWNNLNYQLFDTTGRTILISKFTDQNTLINIKDLSPAVYYLKISNKSNSIKNFKIIKTN